MEDYYLDEIGEIIGAWNKLHDPDADAATDEPSDAMSFLGDGGEVL